MGEVRSQKLGKDSFYQLQDTSCHIHMSLTTSDAHSHHDGENSANQSSLIFTLEFHIIRLHTKTCSNKEIVCTNCLSCGNKLFSCYIIKIKKCHLSGLFLLPQPLADYIILKESSQCLYIVPPFSRGLK